MIQRNLEQNIWHVTVIFILYQIILIQVLTFLFKLDLVLSLVFSTCCLVYNLVITAVLLSKTNLFFNEQNQTRLKVINLANILSLFRISSVFSLFFCYLFVEIPAILVITLVYTALVFISDFFDGFLARKLGQVTTIGKYLDSISDYVVLIFISTVYVYYGLTSVFFFLLVLARLMIMVTGHIVLSLKYKQVKYHISFLDTSSGRHNRIC